MQGLNRSEFLTRAGVAAGALALGRVPSRCRRDRRRTVELAAYYFPQFHPDPRNDGWHGAGWTEWEIVKRGRAALQGPSPAQPPGWGFEDESDPRVDGAQDRRGRRPTGSMRSSSIGTGTRAPSSSAGRSTAATWERATTAA